MKGRAPARAVAAALQWGSVGWLLALWVLVAAGVFVRFVPVASMGWADEIVELAFAWMVFMGAAVLWRDGSHFCVDFLLLHLGDSAAGRGLQLIVRLLSLAFLLVFTYYATVLTLNATDRSPILEYPKVVFYMVMPITGAIMTAYTLRDLWRGVARAAGGGTDRGAGAGERR